MFSLAHKNCWIICMFTEYLIRTDPTYWKCIQSLWQVSQKSSNHHVPQATCRQCHALTVPLFEVIWYAAYSAFGTWLPLRIWGYFGTIPRPTRRPNRTLVYPHEQVCKEIKVSITVWSTRWNRRNRRTWRNWWKWYTIDKNDKNDEIDEIDIIDKIGHIDEMDQIDDTLTYKNCQNKQKSSKYRKYTKSMKSS